MQAIDYEAKRQVDVINRKFLFVQILKDRGLLEKIQNKKMQTGKYSSHKYLAS